MGYVDNLRSKIGNELLILAGVGIFVIDNNKLLMQKRKDNSCWGIHGGVIEVGESVEEAARRELLEETGLIADQLDFFAVFSGKDMTYTYSNGDKVQIISITYICRNFSGTVLESSDEVSKLQWFEFDSLPENISKPEVKQIKAFLDHIRTCK